MHYFSIITIISNFMRKYLENFIIIIIVIDNTHKKSRE